MDSAIQQGQVQSREVQNDQKDCDFITIQGGAPKIATLVYNSNNYGL